MLDIVIRNGLVVDGTGTRPPYKADVGIKEGEILTVGDLEEEIAGVDIDAKGKMVAPGFVDINNHSDTHCTLFRYPMQESLITQGVTTIIGGNCGSSLAPILGEGSIKSLQKWVSLKNVQIDWDRVKEFLEYLEDNTSFKLNFGTLVGHATIRRGILDEKQRSLKEKELELLLQEVSRGMSEGAFGVSAGFAYSHARGSAKKEVEALGEAVSISGGLLAVHLRNEGEKLISSIKEVVDVAKKTGVNLQISHLKALGKGSWHFFERALDMIDKACDEGANINFDVYPYAFSGPVLYTLLPDWLTEGGKQDLLAKLKNKRFKRKAVIEMEKGSLNYGKIIIASCPFSKFIVKRKIEEIAKSRGISPSETVLDLIIASEDQATVFAKLLSERNVRKAIEDNHSIISSNGEGYGLQEIESGNLVHPRSFGAFSRMLGHYTREKKLMSIEKAVYKMSGLPARKLGISLRGEIKEGYKADVQVFDYDEIEDKSTQNHPYKFSKGVEYVIVNGKVSVAEGKIAEGVRSGEILRKN